MGNARILDDFGGSTLSCNGERFDSLDSRLIPFLSRDCVAQSRVDVLVALLAAIALLGAR